MDMENLKENVFKAVRDFEEYLLSRDITTKDLLLEATPFIINILNMTKDYCDKSTLTKQECYAFTAIVMYYYSTHDFLRSITSEYTSEKEILIEINRCVCKEFLTISRNINMLLNERENVGSFINLMDTCLCKIEEICIPNNVCKDLSALDVSVVIVKEILSFALSIAQVGCDDNNKIITAACRTVLNSIDNLKIEINKKEQNGDMINLMIEIYTDVLCALEAKVNIAVLKLCLNIFSNFENLINDFYYACLNFSLDLTKSVSDLVSGFDLHMDRIFQIGLFSLACSSFNERTLDLQILLWHLQFLEKELVPAFVSMTTNSSPYRKKYANILRKCWCTQMKNLRRTVHMIIEPEAYCKLVYEELNAKVEAMWEHISGGSHIEKIMIDPFLSYTRELVKMFKSSAHLLNESKDDALVKRDVILRVLRELSMAQAYLMENCSSYTTKQINLKLFKRCKVLVGTVRDLWICMKGSVLEVHDEESINDVTSDTAHHECINITENVLQSIIEKSQQHIKSRRILHTTITMAPFTNTYLQEDCKRDFSFRKTMMQTSNYSKSSMDKVLNDLKKSFIVPIAE